MTLLEDYSTIVHRVRSSWRPANLELERRVAGMTECSAMIIGVLKPGATPVTCVACAGYR